MRWGGLNSEEYLFKLALGQELVDVFGSFPTCEISSGAAVVLKAVEPAVQGQSIQGMRAWRDHGGKAIDPPEGIVADEDVCGLQDEFREHHTFPLAGDGESRLVAHRLKQHFQHA